MKKLILAIITASILLSGCTKGVQTSTAVLSPATTPVATNTATPEPTATIEATPESPRDDAVSIIVPHWIIFELTESIVEEFIYFQSDYRFITEDENTNTYYLDENDYNKLTEILNPPDFALVKTLYPENFTLVDSIEIDENGDTINVAVLNNSFFTSPNRADITNLAYQCALYKCILGDNQKDISIEVNYTVLDNEKEITTNLPYRINSVVDTTEDMQQEFNIHIPLEYTWGNSEGVKQSLIQAGVEDITINEDGTLDYIAAKELIVKMGNDYHCMMESIFQDISDEVGFITKIYYDALNTTIIIEVDFENCDFEYLESVHRYLNDNTQLEQLFSGVKADDIQFKIVSIDNKNASKIIEMIYPPYRE